MVSGLATQATGASAFRPSRLAISASVDLSGSDSRTRAGMCPQNPVLDCRVFVLEEQFLIDHTGHLRQQSRPRVVFHIERPEYPAF
jgi:hypothetical protein